MASWLIGQARARCGSTATAVAATLQVQQEQENRPVEANVRLIGWDVPEVVSASDNKLRVIAAVEATAKIASSLVSLVVRDEVLSSKFVTSVLRQLCCYDTESGLS